MSTLNHDTELEEILYTYRLGEDVKLSEFGLSEARAALHTYLYKQTLELIGSDEVIDPLDSHGRDGAAWRYGAKNELRRELRKAAVERWGQE